MNEKDKGIQKEEKANRDSTEKIQKGQKKMKENIREIKKFPELMDINLQ